MMTAAIRYMTWPGNAFLCFLLQQYIFLQPLVSVTTSSRSISRFWSVAGPAKAKKEDSNYNLATCMESKASQQVNAAPLVILNCADALGAKLKANGAKSEQHLHGPKTDMRNQKWRRAEIKRKGTQGIAWHEAEHKLKEVSVQQE
jgi:hypothetical protein